PLERALPAVLRRGLVVGGTHVAVKSMLRAGIADDLVCRLRLAVECRAELLDVSNGDAAVLVAEQPEPWRTQLVGVVDKRLEGGNRVRNVAAAVETDRSPEPAAGRDEECHAAAEAETDDADSLVVEAGPAQMVDGRIDVGENAGVTHPGEERHHFREVAVRR